MELFSLRDSKPSDSCPGLKTGDGCALAGTLFFALRISATGLCIKSELCTAEPLSVTSSCYVAYV